MITNCLVTRLREEVDNDNLPRFNTLRIDLSKTASGTELGNGNFTFKFDGIQRVELSGNGYFTDSTFTEDYGKDLNQGGLVYVKVVAKPVILYVSDMSQARGTFMVSRYFTGDASLVPVSQLKYISHDVHEVFQNENQYDAVYLGGDAEVNDVRNNCYGDINTVTFNTKELYMSGCPKLTGDLSSVVIQQATKTNLNTISFGYNFVTFNLSALEGKKYLALITCGRNTSGDIKYFADTRNRWIRSNNTASQEFTGTIEELISRAIANGRTGVSPHGVQDYFAFLLGTEASHNRWTQITYNGAALNTYYQTGSGSYTFIKFTWDAQGNITHEFTFTNPSVSTRYIDLDDVVE